MVDTVKMAVAVALLLAGIAGFYLLGDQPLVLRVLSVLGGVIAAIAVGWFSAPGRRFAEFARDTVTETRKVVWPSRKETTQTTGIVFVFVVILAAFLWLTDKSLEWILYDLILGWR